MTKERGYERDLNDFLRKFFEKSKGPLCLEAYELVSAERGHVKILAPITDKSLNLYGLVHGGVIFSLMDSLAGATAASLGRKTVTLDASVNFISTMGTGCLYAESKVIHNGKSTLIIEVRAYDKKDKTIAKATFTMFSLDKGKS